jgi:hypothetical protein
MTRELRAFDSVGKTFIWTTLMMRKVPKKISLLILQTLTTVILMMNSSKMLIKLNLLIWMVGLLNHHQKNTDISLSLNTWHT